MRIIPNRGDDIYINEVPADVPTKEEVDGKVSKQPLSFGGKYYMLYGQNIGDGKEGVFKVFRSENTVSPPPLDDYKNTIVMRTPSGKIICADPTNAWQAATKGYADEHLAGLALPSLPSDNGTYHLELTINASGTPAASLAWVANT